MSTMLCIMLAAALAQSLLRHSPQHYAMGALFLATKVEECQRKMRDVLAVFMHLEQKRKGLSPQPLDIYSNVRVCTHVRMCVFACACMSCTHTCGACHVELFGRLDASSTLMWPFCSYASHQRYASYKDCLIKAEREILKELGFILYTEHPHKLILNYVKLLTADEASLKKLSQYAWNFINDSQRTNVCIKFAPEVICCAALWMGARVLQIKLPSASSPPYAPSPPVHRRRPPHSCALLPSPTRCKRIPTLPTCRPSCLVVLPGGGSSLTPARRTWMPSARRSRRSTRAAELATWI